MPLMISNSNIEQWTMLISAPEEVFPFLDYINSNYK